MMDEHHVGIPVDFKFTDEKDFLREEVQRYREAALIAYGAIVARNTDGSAAPVLAVLTKYLFPDHAETDASAP